MAYKIQALSAADIPEIISIQPKEWGDISGGFRQHLGQPYFKGIKVVAEKQMLGIGQLIMHEKCCWLGNIITHADFRRKGIGTLITKELIRIGKTQRANAIYLLATQLGEPLYASLGFESISPYLSFQNPSLVKADFTSSSIRPAALADQQQILALDKMASGEDRHLILQPHLANSFVYSTSNSNIDGFYMPTLGDGLIVARTTTAGLQLFEKRQSEAKSLVGVPEQNMEMQTILKSSGYSLTQEVLLMKIGPMKSWHPEMIYSRIGGFLG